MNSVKIIKNLVVTAFAAFYFSSTAQTPTGCGQHLVLENWFKLHPEERARFEQLKISSSRNVETTANSQAALVPTYTIPMVFHILHLGGTENISDAQVIDEVAVLNKMYQKQNADTINVVPSFTNNIANVQFQFKLASLDPNGNCTNGIIRHYTTKTDWQANDFSQFIYTWPPNKYLNIYIVKSMNIPATAYTYIPGLNFPTNSDAIVCLHNACGSIGTSNVTNAWTLTHEVGHWFNLLHTWGGSNSAGMVCGDDGVNDTPITKGFFACNLSSANICSTSIIENMQNYMDYANCPCMFTNGQKQRMHACITSTINSRNNLWSPANLLATGVSSVAVNCIPLLEVAALPATTVCSGAPVSLKSFTYNANPNTYLWATNGGVIASASSASTSITFPIPGIYTVTCTAANASGASSDTVIITVMSGSANVNATNLESFESAFLPPNWFVINPNTPAALWSLTNVASSHSNQSVFVNTENTPGGSIELLQTPAYDFLNNPGSIFTFKYAYALQSNTHKDVFKVQASKDCGGTWKDIYIPSMTTLANGSGDISSSLFIPVSSQWKSYALSNHPNFIPFLNEPNVLIRFYFKEDSVGYGNRIYLDQINFENPTGVNEYSRSLRLRVSPNPSQGEFNFAFTLSETKKLRLSISTISGTTVLELPETTYSAGEHKLSVNEGNSLSPGVYFLNATFDGMRLVRKIIVE
ncbi:MAG: T9SS type A sorting domain-containing protein [Bacteroidia bacterium]|nr:T9SS type A sorting domain-containing protein [Bacteroidia bacterium]